MINITQTDNLQLGGINTMIPRTLLSTDRT